MSDEASKRIEELVANDDRPITITASALKDPSLFHPSSYLPTLVVAGTTVWVGAGSYGDRGGAVGAAQYAATAFLGELFNGELARINDSDTPS